MGNTIGCASSPVLGRAGLVLAWGGTRVVGGGGGLGGLGEPGRRSRVPGPDRAKGPGPGPLGPGAWGPLGPRCGIRVENVTIYCQAGSSYLLSGKATYCQASYLLSGRLSAVSEMHPKGIYLAPKRLHILCTRHPHTCTQPFPHTCTQKAHTLHPRVAAYMHPKVADCTYIFYHI